MCVFNGQKKNRSVQFFFPLKYTCALRQLISATCAHPLCSVSANCAHMEVRSSNVELFLYKVQSNTRLKREEQQSSAVRGAADETTGEQRCPLIFFSTVVTGDAHLCPCRLHLLFNLPSHILSVLLCNFLLRNMTEGTWKSASVDTPP